MIKKTFLYLGLIILLFTPPAFGQKEADVMRRYDYSSPEASFRSLQQAIKDRDWEGFAIHQWLFFRQVKQSDMFNKSFEEAVAMTKAWLEPDQEAPVYVQRLGTYSGPRDYDCPILELRFIKEIDRQKDETGVEGCRIEVEDLGRGGRGYVMAFSFDSKDWWILILPGDFN